jgi:signal peptidase I
MRGNGRGARVAVGAAAAVAALIVTLRMCMMRARVAGASMEPALVDGDRVLVNQFPFGRGGPRAGDIVLVRVPNLAEPIIKRISSVAVESEPIESAPSADTARRRPARQRGIRRYTVLGDNRRASTDSRHFGPVPGTAIAGVVWYRYWPPERRGRLR